MARQHPDHPERLDTHPLIRKFRSFQQAVLAFGQFVLLSLEHLPQPVTHL
jgi:hypothetical protein